MASKEDEVRLLLSSGEEGGGSESEEEEKTSKLSFSARAPWPPLVWGFLSVGLVALGLLEIGRLSATDENGVALNSGATFGTVAGTFSFSVENEYTRVHGASGLSYPWITKEAAIVEPHRITTFVASGAKHTDSMLKWRINGNPMHNSSATLPRQYEHQFSEVGTYEVVVEEWRPEDADSRSIQTASALVHCRYVRREMRSLTDDDRDALLGAMMTLWDEKTTVTKNVYGFAEQHALLAGDSECDHMHDGMGFFTQHLGLTLEMEQALQVVSPSVSLPYWDFTIDAHNIMGEHSGDCEIAVLLFESSSSSSE